MGLKEVQEMKANFTRKPKGVIPQVSEKRKEVNKVYDKVAKQYKKEHPKCEADLEGCTKKTTDIHHQAGRSNAALLINTNYFLACCRSCHSWIEIHPHEALAMGLSVPRLFK